jgi:hypothetical protein
MSMLKLRAQDDEDVQVISAVLQDSIVPLCDMMFQAEDKNFIMVAQRIKREAQTTSSAERICCALTIKGVKAVYTQGVDPKEQDRMLDLLAISYDLTTLRMNLIFAGDAKIRLDLQDWFIAVEDFGEPWPVLCQPCHDDQP